MMSLRQRKRPPRTQPTARFTAAALLVTGTLASTSAHAYLDPGSGSMLLQILLGGIGGLVVMAKLYWHRLLVFFGKQTDEPDELALEELSEQTEDGADP